MYTFISSQIAANEQAAIFLIVLNYIPYASGKMVRIDLYLVQSLFSSDFEIIYCYISTTGQNASSDHFALKATKEFDKAVALISSIWIKFIAMIHAREFLAEMFATFLLVVCFIRSSFVHRT